MEGDPNSESFRGREVEKERPGVNTRARPVPFEDPEIPLKFDKFEELEKFDISSFPSFKRGCGDIIDDATDWMGRMRLGGADEGATSTEEVRGDSNPRFSLFDGRGEAKERFFGFILETDSACCLTGLCCGMFSASLRSSSVFPNKADAGIPPPFECDKKFVS